MSATSSQSVFVPYGAFALKATYQRNLLLAMALTLGLALLLAVVGSLAPGPAAPRIVEGPVNGDGSLGPTKPPIPTFDRPPITSSDIAAPVAAHGTIPVPVADDVPIDDDAAVVDRSELVALVDFRRGSGPGGGGGAE